MKNFIFKALSAGLFALVAFVPAFVNAEAPATGGSSSSADSAPSTSSSSTSASAGAPSTGGSSSTAVASNAPSTGSSATSAGNGSSSGAPSTGSSATSAGTGSSTGAPSTGSSATSAGTDSNTGSDNGSRPSRSGGSRSRGGQGGQGDIGGIALTNVQIEMTAAGLKVSWESTPNTEGRVIYGATSVPTLVTSESNFGYTASTVISGSASTHSVIVPAQLGSVVYLRVMGQNNNRVEFGSEIAVTVPARIINSPAVNSPVDTSVTAPSRGATEVDGNLELDLSKNGKSPLVANPAETTLAQKIGGFFKMIWTAIVSVFR